MGIMSLRLGEKEIKFIEEIARKEKKDKSSVVRELIDYGLNYLMIKQYREGRLSLGKVSKQLNLSISETIDMLADFGIEAPIDYDDYLKGYEVLERAL